MKKFLWFSTLVLVLLFAISCSNGNSSKKNDVTPDEDSDAESVDDDEKDDEENNNDSEPVRQPLECADFAEGLNENLIVGEGNNGLARSFILRLPKEIDSDKKFPVVFLYHGYGQDQGVDAASIEPFLKSYVDNETMPFILVVPEARSDIYGFNNIPPSGFDWDMMNLSDGSAEADMFDAVLDCLGKKWKIDETHIHVSGFSAGAITANSIALMRSEKVASILSYSGAYFSDAASRDALGELMGMKIGDFFSWPDFAEEHTKYPQVFVFGDKKEDAWGEAGMFTIYFNQMGRLGANYLTENGHDAILCEHDQDHIIAGISSESMIKFFAAHPFGTEKSSYREEMPEDFAEICHFFTEEDLEGDDENDDDADSANDDEENDDADSMNDEEIDDTDSNDDEPEDPETSLGCSFKEGLNKNLIVGEGKNKLEREFILHLPSGISSGKKFPVVFLYHGYRDTAENFDSYFSDYVKDEEMPFILVVPESRGDIFNLDNAFSSPTGPTGLEWDIINLENGNAEADMFDKILTCLEKNIDEKHIHLLGYSAGAVAADGIALQRNDKIASVVSISGAYFSNSVNRNALGTISYQEDSILIGEHLKWPDFEKNHTKYPQLFIFGEAGKDIWKTGGDILNIEIDFNQMAQNDGTYFHQNGHDAILCNHGGTHIPPLDNSAMSNAVLKFLKDHPSGTKPSPYQENLPAEFSSSMDCTFVH